MKNQTGIYEIVNLVNGRKIIGSASNIKKRWSNYKSKLKRGTYSNKALQDDFNKYGIHNFEFRVIKECKKSDLSILEQYWIDVYWDTGVLYNRNRVKKTQKKIRRGKEAAIDKRRRSELNSGENNPRHSGKLSIDDVRVIKNMINQGMKNREIYPFFKDKLNKPMISRIRSGDRYKSVV